MAYCLLQISFMFFNLHYIIKTSTLVVYDVACTKNFTNYLKLKTEGPYYSKPVDKPKSTWPERGDIDFRNVNVIYDSPKVENVRALNISIRDKEKIAILGKNGSGAATIVGILFNIYKRYGHVFIDGVHIDDVGLYELRKQISIIPKHPVIISTTLRENIDLFGKFTSQAIADVLDEVGLSYGSLDEQVRDENYTMVEKQLISLARVLLNPGRIIIIHENDIRSTTRADLLLHQLVRRKFHKNTVITVSNKIGHLMYLDRILIMDEGIVVADDNPRNLIRNNCEYLDPFLEELDYLKRNNMTVDVDASQLDIINSIIRVTSNISRTSR